MVNKLTVLITCKDERRNIARCIESIRAIADEILIADSGSTDGTLQYVRGRGDCRVIEREYCTAGDFRGWAVPQAAHAWVLQLDADERLSPALADEIRDLLDRGPECDGYWMPRRNYLMGHPVNHTSWGRDRALRLFRRDATTFDASVDHVTACVAGEVGLLSNVLEHFTIWSWAEWFKKTDRYSRIQAEVWHAAGRKPSLGQLLLRPLFRFLREYVLFRGFLDGMAGAQVAWSCACYCFLKQARLWELDAARSRAQAERRLLRPADAPHRPTSATSPPIPWRRLQGVCRRALSLFM